jgi:hypothetical protein
MPAPDYSTEIAALEAAIAGGELTIESDGDRVTYKSTADMLSALNYFRNQAAAAANTRRGGSSVGVYQGD